LGEHSEGDASTEVGERGWSDILSS
jgi:hypothetical protein